MGRNSGHTPKSKIQKDFYTRYIKEQNYEPTVDESLGFDTSNDKEEDFSLQKAERKRKEPKKDIILRHFEENWVKWVFSFAGIALLYFFFTFQVNLSRTDSRSLENEKDISNLNVDTDKEVERLDKEIEKLEGKIELEKDKNQQQDLNIQRNSIMIENKKSSKNGM